VRTRLFVLSLALVALALAAAEAYLPAAVSDPIAAATSSELLARARVLALAASESTFDADDRESWVRLATAASGASGDRVTFLRTDGTVIGDSPPRGDVGAEPPGIDPEIREGLVRDGARVRTPGNPSMAYAAAPFQRFGVAGTVHLSRSLEAVDIAREHVRSMLWLGAGVALALALALSHLSANRLTAVTSELTRAARRMADGDLTVRTRLPGQDELAELGHALDRLAGGMAATLGELRGERDLQKRILEAMHEGVVVVDGDGRIVLVNPALRAMLLLGADAVGKLLIETVRHAQLHTMLENARAARDDRQVELELPGLKPRRMLVQVAPLDEGMLFVFVDVTELRRLESLRRDFVANASHELRTPIAAVRSATETLRFGAIEDRQAATRFVDIIERNAVRLQSLVEDMLELSKLESNEFKLKRERVELQRVVPIVLALFRERAEKKGVRLSSELPPTLAAVDGDPRALEHVLSNLVDNAVKYCPAGSRILVGAAEDDGRVRLVVSDTGPGIAPEHLSRVFERFYRVDAGRSRELGGTGLGLSIVKHMVEAMRGKVSVESTVGRGSTFSVALHRADASVNGRDSENIRIS
jgi:two-component system phosphate regulon sensor histidine kinase PhoR